MFTRLNKIHGSSLEKGVVFVELALITSGLMLVLFGAITLYGVLADDITSIEALRRAGLRITRTEVDPESRLGSSNLLRCSMFIRVVEEELKASGLEAREFRISLASVRSKEIGMRSSQLVKIRRISTSLASRARPSELKISLASLASGDPVSCMADGRGGVLAGED